MYKETGPPWKNPGETTYFYSLIYHLRSIAKDIKSAPLKANLLLALKVFVIIAIFYLDFRSHNSEFVERRLSDGAYLKLAIIFAIQLTCLVSIFFMVFLESRFLRVLGFSIFLLFTSLNQIAFWTVGEGLDIEFLAELLGSREMLLALPMFLVEFQTMTFLSVSLFVATLVLFSYSPSGIRANFPRKYAFFPLFLLMSVFILWTIHYSNKFENRLPTAFSLSFEMSKCYVKSVKYRSFVRKEVDYHQEYGQGPKKIVYIMDESVFGEALSVNSGPEKATPFLKNDIKNMVNFGVAVSSGNISFLSNLVARVGLRNDQIPDEQLESLKIPNFWQYAKRAGYKTTYVNSWRVFTNNYMTKDELFKVDHVYGIGSTDRAYRDMVACSELRETLASDTREFIFVNKYGTHWPYAAAYPAGRDIFYPIMGDYYKLNTVIWEPKNELNKFFTTASRARTMEIQPNQEAHLDSFLYKNMSGIDLHSTNTDVKRMNTYLNAVNWSVDEFFRCLLTDLDLGDTVIIYTSDHGQYVTDKGGIGAYNSGHGSRANPNVEEGLVPLLVFTDNPEYKNMFQTAATASFGKMTHFQIFPTLALLMGYERNWVQNNLGASLLDPPPAKREFAYGSMFDGDTTNFYKVD